MPRPAPGIVEEYKEALELGIISQREYDELIDPDAHPASSVCQAVVEVEAMAPAPTVAVKPPEAPNAPDCEVEVEIEVPHVEVEVKAPKAPDVEVKARKVSPKVAPEVKAPKAPDVEVDVKAPKSPDVDTPVSPHSARTLVRELQERNQDLEEAQLQLIRAQAESRRATEARRQQEAMADKGKGWRQRQEQSAQEERQRIAVDWDSMEGKAAESEAKAKEATAKLEVERLQRQLAEAEVDDLKRRLARKKDKLVAVPEGEPISINPKSETQQSAEASEAARQKALAIYHAPSSYEARKAKKAKAAKDAQAAKAIIASQAEVRLQDEAAAREAAEIELAQLRIELAQQQEGGKNGCRAPDVEVQVRAPNAPDEELDAVKQKWKLAYSGQRQEKLLLLSENAEKKKALEAARAEAEERSGELQKAERRAKELSHKAALTQIKLVLKQISLGQEGVAVHQWHQHATSSGKVPSVDLKMGDKTPKAPDCEVEVEIEVPHVEVDVKAPKSHLEVDPEEAAYQQWAQGYEAASMGGKGAAQIKRRNDTPDQHGSRTEFPAGWHVAGGAVVTGPHEEVVKLGNGAEVHLEAGAVLSVEAGAELKLEKGAKISLGDGAELIVKAEASVLVESLAELRLLARARIQFDKGAVGNVRFGELVKLRGERTLRDVIKIY